LSNTKLIVLLSLLLLAIVASGQTRTTAPGHAAPGLLPNQKWIEETHGSIPDSSSLHVKVEGGSIRVVGGPQEEITYSVRIRTRGQGAAQISQRRLHEVSLVSRDGMVSLTVKPKPLNSPRFVGEILLRVPQHLHSLNLQTSGGDISVDGFNGRVDLRTGGGRVQLDHMGGDVTVETGGDDIEVGEVAGDTSFRTGGGRISVRSAGGAMRASSGGGNIFVDAGLRTAVLESAAGDIQMNLCGGQLKVSTGGGNVVLGTVHGSAEITTSGGNIHLHSATGFVHAQTRAGGIELDGVPAASAETEVGAITARFTTTPSPPRDSRLRTSVGDISIYLPENMAVTVRASVDMSMGQRISSDFPELQPASQGDRWDSQPQTLEGKLNGGGPLLLLNTGNGKIVIHRLPR
jgi:hypothetical protein